MSDLDTRLLRSFLSVAETGSMTAAAARSHQTQGAVSQQIKRLETLLGHRLFVRSGQGLKLTSGGQQLVPQAVELLDRCQHIFDQFQSTSASRTIRFGMPYDLVSTYLAPILEAFGQRFPEIDVDLYCEPSPILKQMGQTGKVDLAIVEEPAAQASGTILRVEPLVWVGKPGGRAAFKRPLPISLVAPSCAFRPSVEKALTSVGTVWRTVFENGDLNATMATVRSDMAITASLGSLVPPELATLSEAYNLPELGPFAIGLYPTHQDLNGATRELSAFIQASALG